MELHRNNPIIFHLVKNQVFHARIKHIDVRCHKLNKIINDVLVNLVKIYTDDETLDIFTKPVTSKKFRNCLGFIGVSHL